MKKILITNDDGYQSPGLHALKEALEQMAEVCVIAPCKERSACGHGLTLTKPLWLSKLDEGFYKLDDGSPTDCIHLALHGLYEAKPDLIVSGINLGSNMGEDVSYSGTASGAMEGVLHGIPSIAISQFIQEGQSIDFSLAKQTITTLVSKIFSQSFPLKEREFLNINIPPIKPNQCKGIKITELGYRIYHNKIDQRTNPRGEEYYWLGMHGLEWKKRSKALCDFEALENHYISITPILLDFTARDSISSLQSWLEQ